MYVTHLVVQRALALMVREMIKSAGSCARGWCRVKVFRCVRGTGPTRAWLMATKVADDSMLCCCSGCGLKIVCVVTTVGWYKLAGEEVEKKK